MYLKLTKSDLQDITGWYIWITEINVSHWDQLRLQPIGAYRPVKFTLFYILKEVYKDKNAAES